MAETITEVQFSYAPIFEFPKVAETYTKAKKINLTNFFSLSKMFYL